MPIILTDDEAYAAFLILDTVARVELGTVPNTVYLREKLLPAYRDWRAANPFKVHPPLDLSIGKGT